MLCYRQALDHSSSPTEVGMLLFSSKVTDANYINKTIKKEVKKHYKKLGKEEIEIGGKLKPHFKLFNANEIEKDKTKPYHQHYWFSFVFEADFIK